MPQPIPTGFTKDDVLKAIADIDAGMPILGWMADTEISDHSQVAENRPMLSF